MPNERIKQLQDQIYSMECAYDDLMLNYKDEYDALHRELRELEEGFKFKRIHPRE